ncbi:MAG TPA: protoporphyrinogen oxidase [Gemmataceae bacterium]|nr:protoporphyrinogen oxidase [Gemmataceae bacterium]
MPSVVIVGGGLSGLSLAYRLQQAAPRVEITLLEKDDRPGGKIHTDTHDGFRVEWGPNGFLDTKPTTATLCRDLGLGDRLLPASEAAGKNRYLFLRGQLARLPDGIGSFLRTPVLSWRGKWGLLTERFRRPRRDGADESIDAFARRRAGDEVADVLADAFVTGIHAGDPKLLSLRSTFPRLAELEEQYGSVMKGFAAAARQRRAEAKARGEVYQRPGKMWSFREGLQALIDGLRASLRRPPNLGAAARHIEGGEGRPNWTVRGEGQDQWQADAVVLACPAYEQAAILADLDADLAEQVNGIPYNRVAVVAIGYRQEDVPIPLDGFGFLVPQRDQRDLLGVQWCSSIFPERAPPGTVLLRAMCGGWSRAEMVGWDDGRLLATVRAELRAAMGVTAEPVFHRIVRWERAIPQYHLGHQERLARIEERARRYPGLFLAGNAYRGVAMNDCTEQAVALAADVRRLVGG